MTHTHYHFESTPSPYDSFLKHRPRLLYTGLVKDVKNWVSEPSNHTFYEMLYFYRGQGSVIIGDSRLAVKPGDLVTYHPGRVHHEETSSKDPFQFVFMAFESPMELGGEAGLIPSGKENPLSFDGTQRFHLEDTFFRLLNEAQNHVEGFDVLCDSLLADIIVQINRMRSVAGGQAEPASESQRIKAYIDEFYDHDLTLDRLSEIVYVSKHHLAHAFKNEIGVPPITYLIKRRMDEAKRMLAETSMTIADISNKIGYDNPNYFSQMFKKLEGQSPLGYRNAHRK